VAQEISQPPEPTALLHRGGDEDEYVLRGLLWCGRCAELMVPVLLDTGTTNVRVYACRSGQCLRPQVEAKLIETLVWNRFVMLNPAMAEGVLIGRRRSVIRPVLSKVRMGDDENELSFDWRN
jgi:hypothetical protein